MPELLNIPLASIDVPEDRARDFVPDWAEALAAIIGNQGMTHPIRVRRMGSRYLLVVGRHRLEAHRLLGAESIASQISTAETDDEARLEEVMENLGRHELIALDRCRHLFELKQVWERMYPETANGGDRGNQHTGGRTQTLRSASEGQEIFGFARSNAEKVGLSKRSIELAVKIWTELSPTSRLRLAGTDLARKQTELKALSELDEKRQAAALDLILGDADVTNVAGALQALDGGVVPDRVEKELTALRTRVSALPDPVFDRLILENEERVLAALKRQGRIG